MNQHTPGLNPARRFPACCLLALAALSFACRNESVVPNNPAPASSASPAAASSPLTPAATPAAIAATGASPASVLPGIPPAGVPTAPTAPGTPTMPSAIPTLAAAAGATPQTSSTPRRIGDFPMETSKAKPAATLEPDPFPARPTPTVVLKDGKIVQQWPAPAEALSMTNPVKNNPNAAKLGREYYLQKCGDCHGKDGKGNGWMGQQLKRDGKPLAPTNLAGQMVQANTDGELFWKITNGRSPMPAHRVRFEDEQRWQIVAFLRTLK